MRTSLIPSLHIKIVIIYFSLLDTAWIASLALWCLSLSDTAWIVSLALLFLQAAALPKRVKWHMVLSFILVSRRAADVSLLAKMGD